MKSTLIYYLTKALLHFLASLSLPLNHKLGELLGKGAYVFNSKARKISEINIKTCMPDLSAEQQADLVRKALIELGKSLTELGPMWLWDTEKLFSYLQVEGRGVAQAAINNNQGVILATPHLGCWEIAGLYLGHQWTTSIFYQSPKVKSLDPIFRNARARSGANLLATDKKGLIALLRALKKGKSIGILPDQTPKQLSSGTFAPFFGRPTLTINLISQLVKKTDAIVLVGFAERLKNGQGYLLRIQQGEAGIDSSNPLTATTALNKTVEKLIAIAPEQYLWNYKRFKKYPEGVEKLY